MTARDVVAILDRLGAAEVEVWLDGGWGVDALLGEQTRDHKDLDLVARLDDVPALREALARDGFRYDRGTPDSNFVLRDEHGREVDVHPVHFDEEGDGIYLMEDGEDWIYPAAGFSGRGTVGGREVRCLTPDVAMLCHTGGYEPSWTDFHDMQLLNERFGTELLPPFDAPLPPSRDPSG